MRACFSALIAAGVLFAVAAACGGSDSSTPPPAAADSGTGSPDNTGQARKTPAECYPGIDAGALQGGAVQCLDRVPGGYCTHLCKSDADCCAVPGECKGSLKQVCSPFESTGQMMCFLSCEEADIRPARDGGVLDETTFCATYATAQFKCRSSGGGSKNRKVCVPE